MKELITNLTVIDGTGAKAFRGSIGIDGKNLAVFREGEKLPPADAYTDGTGLTAVPGFLDAHSHGDLMLRSEYPFRSKHSQGITTQIAGQCGFSLFPFLSETENTASYRQLIESIAPHAEFPEDFSLLKNAAGVRIWSESAGHPLRTRCFVGHGTLRLAVMGYEMRRPSPAELDRMRELLRENIRMGALGLSTGLVYAPGCFAEEDELLSLLEVVREEGGIYATHPRNEADTCVEARLESIRHARAAGVPLCLSHMKAAGRDNHGKPALILQTVDEALRSGQKILMDCYPYYAGNTSLNVSIPPQYFRNGPDGLVKALETPSEARIIETAIASKTKDYENYIYNCGGYAGVYVSSCPIFHDAEGMFLTEYAEKTGQSPFEAYREILIKNRGLGLAFYFHMDPADVRSILSHPACAVGTDGLLGLPSDNPHPRTFGSMPEAFRLLTGECGLTAEAAVSKMTRLPASFFGFEDLGTLQTGKTADFLLLDLPRFRSESTYEHGSLPCTGIRRVYYEGNASPA